MRVGQVRRRDEAERAIVDGLRACGVDVWPISGEGVPDLLTFFRGQWLPIEVKHDRPRRSLTEVKARCLTPAQEEIWQRTHFPIVRTLDEAMQAIGISYGYQP